MGGALVDDGLSKLVWSECDAVLGGVLVASPADAHGRGIELHVERGGAGVDLTGAHVYLVWRHRELRRRGCEPFEAVDAAAGKFRVFYPAAMAGAEGTVDAQIMVSFGDERTLSSRAFSIRVEQVLVGGSASPDGFSLFVETIKKYEEAASAALDVAGELRRAAAAGEFDGRDGVDGAPGRDGVDGKDGSPGEKGDKGEPGEPGPQGPQGETGPAGADGLPGKDGKDGIDGAPGKDGAKGDPGETGPQGPQGEAGPQGPQGEPGKDGADGTKIRSVTDKLKTDNSTYTFNSAAGAYAKGEWLVDKDKMLCYVERIDRDADAGKDSVRVRFVANLRGPGLLTCRGLDVEPGAVTSSCIDAKGMYARVGDLVLSTDTGCLGAVSKVDTPYQESAYVYVKGLARLGAPDLSGYATKAYVDGSFASKEYVDAAAPDLGDYATKSYVDAKFDSIQSLEEVAF